MSAAAAVNAQAGPLVRRARAGDQNAMALIREVGIAAQRGVERAQLAYKAILKYIEGNPAPAAEGGLFGFGGETLPDMPSAPQALVEVAPHQQMEKLPVLPRGALDQLFSADDLPIVVARACKYANGLNAAAVVLASGPGITRKDVEQMALSLFGSDEASNAFLYGVKHPSDEERYEIAQELDVDLRRPFVVGQCVGRAVKLQMVRQPQSSLTRFDPAVGWEFGE